MKTLSSKMFYKSSKLSTIISSDAYYTIASAKSLNLCETSSQTSILRLLGSDFQNSTLFTVSKTLSPVSYTPFGQDNLTANCLLLSRFTGQYHSQEVMCYFLGNGYRLFNTQIMRFLSSDRFAPFGKGGINAYAYCEDDPINNADASGEGRTNTSKLNRQALYEKFDRMIHRRKSDATISKTNTIGEKAYQALKELVESDLDYSTKRLDNEHKVKTSINEEIFNNHEQYSTKEINAAYSKANTAIEIAEALHAHDTESHDLIGQLQAITYNNKKRYYLPSHQNSTIRQNVQRGIFQERRIHYSKTQ